MGCGFLTGATRFGLPPEWLMRIGEKSQGDVDCVPRPRWVWTTGRFKRGAGMWIVYHRHKDLGHHQNGYRGRWWLT